MDLPALFLYKIHLFLYFMGQYSAKCLFYGSYFNLRHTFVYFSSILLTKVSFEIEN